MEIRQLGGSTKFGIGADEDISIPKTLTYNENGTLNVITTSIGTKTLGYNLDGTLATITGTGSYKDKTFTYTDGKLTSIGVA
jgi:hypothetical protein